MGDSRRSSIELVDEGEETDEEREVGGERDGGREEK
jgi:hypothetical protein